MAAAFNYRDPITSITLDATPYAYGRGIPEHGWQLTTSREGQVRAALRLPREQACLLAMAILGSYQDDTLDDPGQLLTPRQVAELLRVDPKTVSRWAKAGKLRHMRTIGGHRRFAAEAVQELMREHGGPDRG